MQVLVKWYNIYNAPGGPSAHAEWNLFVTCFMTLMGYNTERLTWTRNVSHLCVFYSILTKPYLTLMTSFPVLTLPSPCLQLHFEVPLSPVIAAKKARPSDGGSDEVCGKCLICCDVAPSMSSLR